MQAPVGMQCWMHYLAIVLRKSADSGCIPDALRRGWMQ
jgi:hypothetical protein